MNNSFSTYAIGAAGGVFAAAGFFHWQNTALQTKRYVYFSPKLPQRFKGFRIAHISDYHNTRIMERKLIKATEYENPDIIVITGDLFDSRKTDVQAGLSLTEKLANIAPVYMVCGNHEARIENIGRIKIALEETGVNIVENKEVIIHRKNSHITLLGVADPKFYPSSDKEGDRGMFRNNLLSFAEGRTGFNLLISHRPEFIHTYRDSGVDLVLAGHAHGGQFGIPFTDMGVFVPNQGLFPPYAAGYKQMGNTTMIISRGIGNSAFPFRLFNYPELVTVEFE